MKTFFIGIDVSNNWLDYGVCTDLSKLESIVVKRVTNTVEGINSLIRECKKFRANLWFCLEHTGYYGILLAHKFQLAGLTYSMVPSLEIKQSLGMVRGKSDKIDAKRISEYAAKNSYKLKPTQLPSNDLLKLKTLFTRREQLVRKSTQLKNSLKSHKKLADVIDYDYVVTDIEEELALNNERIKKINKVLKQVIESNQELKTNYKKAIAVKGIGPSTSTFMLICTNNFASFSDPRKFNSYAGLAPFENSSGSSIRGKTKTSKLRNRVIKTLLFNAARSASNHDKQLRAYYQRKKKEGKPTFLVLNNVAVKLVSRVFAMIKREEPFVELAF